MTKLQDTTHTSKDLQRTSSVFEPTLTKVAYTCNGDDGKAKKSKKSSSNAYASCLDIKEPEANEELTGEKEVYMKATLREYTQRWVDMTKHTLGYPVNLQYEYGALDELQKLTLNNIGDPFTEGSYGVNSRDFEVGVLDWFARLWEIERDQYWGYITSGGTEANFHGILVGREMYPDGILYASKESHYSIFKAAHMYRMKCVMVETLASGHIDCADLRFKLLQNKDKPAILNINIGTTVKGAVDDLDLVLQILEECKFQRNRFYIHCDGALFGVMVPFITPVPELTFKKPIDSICISGHKFVGCPMPCGVQIVRKEHIEVLSRNVEYIASRDVTIMGSRSGQAPVFLWYTLNRKGYSWFRQEVQRCLKNAQYLKTQLKKAGVSVMLNESSNIVVFERPRDDDFIRYWQLACQGKISHIVVMPSTTIDSLNMFFNELIKKRSMWYNGEGDQPPCVAFEIGKDNCACGVHKLVNTGAC